MTNKNCTFNKKNAIDFGKNFYRDENGMISFKKLCVGELADIDHREGNTTLHCAVGEAYYHFVNHRLSRVDFDTGRAIEALAKKAQRADGVEIDDVEAALGSCVDGNDHNDHDNAPNQYETRARVVQERWMNEVVPLLK